MLEVLGLTYQDALILGSLLSSFFGGLWTLVRMLIFKPLEEINENLKDMKDIMMKAEVRIGRLEEKEESVEHRLMMLESKVNLIQ